MPIRLQELHPSLVHLPIAMLPVAIGVDLAGHATGNRNLLGAGRRGIKFAAVGAAASALSGLIAAEEVNVKGETMDMLITHRNLNLSLTITAALMAIWRSRRARPSLGYLALGLAGIAGVAYAGYLGGRLVYEYGVGVKLAGGQYRENPPELGTGQTEAFVRDAATDLMHGAMHLGQELAQGRIAPSLGVGLRESPAAAGV